MKDKSLIERLEGIECTVDHALINRWRKTAAMEYIDKVNDPDYEITETYQGYLDRRVSELHTAMIDASKGQTTNPYDNAHWEGEPDD